MRRLCIIVFAAFAVVGRLNSQDKAHIPMIGAQIIVEPWQSPYEVELWFRSMSDNGLSVCRIRMFEEYLKTEDGTWCFDCFDTAFDAAKKYGIKVFATLFPSAKGSNSLGGFKHPSDEEHLSRISTYIEAVVQHYKEHPALLGWVLMNEPGTGGSYPSGELAAKKMKEWEHSHKSSPSWTEGFSSDIFNKNRFLVDYNTWYISWLSEQVRKYDSTGNIHINNHQIFENVAEYDFPMWRQSITSLGASAHPSWHFGYFPRNRYAMAMSANCQIVRSGAEDIPFWVTELQGGNNTYSGNQAFCPTAEEITQWLWTSIANGADGIIFWCYNPRTIGEEAGEWALINNDNTNSDRLDAAKEVIFCLNTNSSLFKIARPAESKISIIYIRESLWAESQMQIVPLKDTDWEGRQKGGVMKSAIGTYEALLSYGINASFKEFSEYDWDKDDYSGNVILLSNQIAIPSYHIEHLKHFVKCGGKLIVEGITGFYDENLRSLNNVGRPLEDLLGGILSEVKAIPGDFKMAFDCPAPVHLWKGYISNTTGEVLFKENGIPTATRNMYGRGECLWIPSLLALGARRSQNYAPYADFLKKECPSPISFTAYEPSVLMTLMETSDSVLAFFVNKANARKKVTLTGVHGVGKVIYANKGGRVNKSTVTIAPEETVLVSWSK